GLELRALVVGEVPAAVRRLLRPDRPAGLSKRRPTGREHDPSHACPSRREDDVPRAANVDLEHRRRITKAEGVRAGGVVDDVAAAHRGRQLLAVDDVTPHRLCAQRAELARRGVRPGERLHLAAGAQQPLHDRAAEKPGATGNEDRPARHRYRTRSERDEEKRVRYSTADITVIAAAAIRAHSSTRRGPSGPPRWRMARKIATNW